MMRAVICEDDPEYREALLAAVARYGQARERADIETAAFSSSEDLCERLTGGLRADILLLDIEIPNELSGMELARLARSLDPDVLIVFVTDYSEYVYEGYTVNALRYLKKPASDASLFECLDIAMRHHDLMHTKGRVLNVPGAQIALRFSEIISIEARSPDVLISVRGMPEPIVARCRLQALLALLPASLFVPCHRSYVVSVAQVRVLRRTQVTLANGAVLPVSKTYADALFDAFAAYHQGGLAGHGVDVL